MSEVLFCPVCEYQPVQTWASPRTASELHCPVCGTFAIGFRMLAVLTAERQKGLSAEWHDSLSALSIAIRHAATPPEISLENYEALAREAPRWSIDTKLRRLLEAIGQRAPKGRDTSLGPNELRQLAPELTARDQAEVRMLVEGLADRGLILAPWAGGSFGPVRVKLEGWRALEPPAGGVPNRCFVAMWFNPDMNAAYDNGFFKAIVDCGLEPRRIDKLPLDGKICDGILAEIRHAEVVIADFTDLRSGVFFEAGFALALDKMVVFTCRSDYFDKLAEHFDTRQYQYLKWQDPADLRQKLADHIRARRAARPPA